MSPIRLTDDVTVPAGITLTILSGVEVQFAKTPAHTGGYYQTLTELLIEGAIVADGGDPATATGIAFVSDAAIPDAGDWGMLLVSQNGQGAFRNVYMAHGAGCLNARHSARVTVRESWFELCGDFDNLTGGAVVRAEDASLEVYDSLFYENLVGLYFHGNRATATLTAQRNAMQFNAYGVYLTIASNPSLTGNDISMNLVGLRANDQSAPAVYNNFFEDNEISGVEVRNQAVLTNFQHNNINNPEARASEGFDLSYANSTVELQAINNYWGPFTEAEIETHIRHRPDDPLLGLVRFVPFATSPFPVPESGRWGDLFISRPGPRNVNHGLEQNSGRIPFPHLPASTIKELTDRMRGLP